MNSPEFNTMDKQEKIKLYTDLKPGEHWGCPTSKITIKIPTSAVEALLKPFSEKRGATVAWWAGMFLMHGIACHIHQYEETERARRKEAGYLKRSLRRYGIEPTEEDLDDYLEED